MTKINIKAKERNAVVESLKSGIVPKIGIQHIQVGRSKEVEEIIKDYSIISEGGAKSRFIIGEYGSGKTFFLTLSKLMAHQKNLVVMSADITLEKLLCSSDGKAKALFSELINNISTKTKPDGNALKSIIERWAVNVLEQNEEIKVEDISRLLMPLEKHVSSYDFSKVIKMYLTAYKDGDEVKMSQSIRWLRAEYNTKTDARMDLGVRSIIEDNNFYDYLKLFSEFVRLAGYRGLIVNIDELAVISRLRSSLRNKNFERILNIVNDSLQGGTENIGFMFGGTPEFLEDNFKGMFSYGALKTRLAENPFAKEGLKDLTGPIIRLDNLSQEELFILFVKIRYVFASGCEDKYLINDEQIEMFMQWLLNRLGAEAFLSPRESIKQYIGLLSQLENYPDVPIEEHLGKVSKVNKNEDDAGELTNFKL